MSYRQPVGTARYLIGSAVVLAGCGFQPTNGVVDGKVPDAKGDAPVDTSSGALPTSCKDLHATNPALPSGTYVIDPDGPGGDDKLSVTCDMVADGGGWTIVYFPSTDNVQSSSDYTSSTPRLLTDAQAVLIAYRDDAQVVVSSIAIFALPSQWRTNSPFSYSGNDLSVSARIDGSAAVNTTVRYGYGNFGSTCNDSWLAGPPFGRVCVTSTTAPFFAGFADASGDYCNSSLGSWNSSACSLSVRFSLAVR